MTPGIPGGLSNRVRPAAAAESAKPKREELRRAAVIGGGIAGLVGAWELQKAGVPTTLFEASERLGGIVGRAELAGPGSETYTVDAGAESFALRGGHVGALIEELGLGEQTTVPRPNPAWLQVGEHAHPLPALSLHGIPSVPLANDVIAVLGWGGALRAHLDRLLPVGNPRDESFADLVRRRMGAKVLERLVRPIFGGIRSIAPEKVSPAAAAPGLLEAMTRAGSLSGAVALLRSAQAPGSPVGGLVGGMHTLVDALEQSFLALGGTIHRGTASAPAPARATRLEDAEALGLATGSGWAIESAAAPEPVRADLLLVAVDPSGLDPLLALLGGEPEPEWRAPETEPVVLATLLLDAPALDAHPRGSGVLVAQPGDRAKALTHSSAKWSWWSERLTPGRHLVRLSYREAPAEPPAFAETALADAARLLGIPLGGDQLLAVHRQEWRMPVLHSPAGLPPLAPRPGLALTGSAIAGTGLAATIPHARGAARELLGHRG